MGFEKGRKKTGGRQKGTPNHLTVIKKAKLAEVERILDEAGVDPLKGILDLLPGLDERDRANVLIALLPYRYPKLKPIDPPKPNPFSEMTPSDQAKALRSMADLIEQEAKDIPLDPTQTERPPR